MTTMEHRTTTMERHMAAAPEVVFNAWADAETRQRWSSPSSEIDCAFEEERFAVGGRDVTILSMGGQPIARAVADYHDIVDGRRIVFSETIAGEGQTQGVSLVSVDLLADGDGTRMVLTLQTVALDGSTLLDEVIEGWTAALESLGREVQAVA